MTLVVEVDGVALAEGALIMVGPNNDIPGGVQGLPLAAWYGEALTGGYVIDDPEGIYDFTGLHTIVAYETAATRPFISGGWITGRRVERGPYKSGASRIHHVDFIDINWNFALMVFRASSAKRPAETDIARFAFIQASAPMAFTPSHDNGRFNVTDNPVSFDDSDLVTRFPIEAINEFAGIAGKNFYNYWDNDTEEISLHYDLVGVGPASAMAVSNDMADAGAGVFYPYLDAELDQGPAWKVTGMLLRYRGAYAYGIRQATIDELSPSIFSPSEFQRDEVYSTDRIGRLATANAQIVSMLNDRSVDIETIKVTVELPAANVNDAYPGEILPVTFTHLPGYETEVELPIIRRNVVPKDGRTDTYLVHFELSGKGLPSGPGGGDPGGFPHQPADCGDIDLVNFNEGSFLADIDFGFTATEGNLLLLILSVRNQGVATPVPPTGWSTVIYQRGFNPVGFQDSVVVYGKISDGTEDEVTPLINTWPTTDGGNWFIEEWAGLTLPAGVALKNVGSGTAMVGEDIVVPGPGMAMGIFVQSQDTATTFTPGAGWTQAQEETDGSHPETLIEYKITTVATTETPDATSSKTNGWRSVSLFFSCVNTDSPPASGTPVPDVPAAGDIDGSNTDFTAPYPFADESLEVYHDGTDQTPHVTDYDGAAGTFTLDYAPSAGSVITVRFQGR